MAISAHHPNTPAARILDGHRLLDSGRLSEARQLADELALQPLDDVSSLGNLAALYFRLGHFIKAIAFYLKALQVDPENAITMSSLATAYLYNQEYLEADHWLTLALVKDPKCVAAVAGKAQVLLAAGNYELAAEWFKKAVEMGSQDVAAITSLSLVMVFLGRNEEALEYAEQAQRRFPGNHKVLYALAKTYMSLGRMKEAESCLKKAIKLYPANGGAFLLLTSFRKFTRDDTPLVEQILRELKGSLLVQNRAHFLFALGKIYDDIGEHAKAFASFQQANLLVKQQDKPDNDRHLVKYQKKLLGTRAQILPAIRPEAPVIPIFVVGMPRSGTSLVEQIIASHPEAAGAGELVNIPVIAQNLFDAAKGKKFLGVQTFAEPDSQVWLKQREEYLRHLQSRSGGARYVVDKLPENFRFLGFITLLFPEAKIVHVSRHPLDTCLSCYFQAFETLPWTNDLGWIADTYCDYRKLMEYWHRVLPEGMMVDISYEKLTMDLEQESMRLLRGVGLDWNPVCLDFHKAERVVNTASVWQVRQPIYQSSKMRWVPYAYQLSGLASCLAQYLSEEDRQLYAERGIDLKSPSWLRRLIG